MAVLELSLLWSSLELSCCGLPGTVPAAAVLELSLLRLTLELSLLRLSWNCPCCGYPGTVPAAAVPVPVLPVLPAVPVPVFPALPAVPVPVFPALPAVPVPVLPALPAVPSPLLISGHNSGKICIITHLCATISTKCHFHFPPWFYHDMLLAFMH